MTTDQKFALDISYHANPFRKADKTASISFLNNCYDFWNRLNLSEPTQYKKNNKEKTRSRFRIRKWGRFSLVGSTFNYLTSSSLIYF